MPRAASKYFQDPVYGQMAIRSPLLLGLIDTRAVQRLKHIRQLGVAFFTFLGAEHSRFSHSLGCMRLMEMALDHLSREEGLRVTAEQRELALATALLHDVGHCAFSHTLEGVLAHRHEIMSVRMLSEDLQIKKLLGSRAKTIGQILSGAKVSGTLSVVKDLVSSQLDVDRLDYLVRDAHYTGVNSGQVDLSRIIAQLTVRQGRLLVKEKGLLAVEEYFLARYFMYWKVYFHKTSRGLELILKGLLRRAKELMASDRLPEGGLSPALAAMLALGDRVSVAQFIDHDDSDIMVAIKAWQRAADPVLRDLSLRFLNRRKFSLIWEAEDLEAVPSPRARQRAHEFFEKRLKGSGDYYFIQDSIGTLPYDPELPVYVLAENGKKTDLARRSRLIQEITRRLAHARYYAPEEDAASVAKLLKGSA